MEESPKAATSYTLYPRPYETPRYSNIGTLPRPWEFEYEDTCLHETSFQPYDTIQQDNELPHDMIILVYSMFDVLLDNQTTRSIKDGLPHETIHHTNTMFNALPMT